MSVKRCVTCPVKDMQDRLETIDGLPIMKLWFNDVCNRCKKNNRVAKSICDNGDRSNIISDMSSVLVDKDGGIFDERNDKVLEKGFLSVRREIS